MQVTIHTYLIVLPLLFLGGFVDSIGGGGGLVSLPAYLLAGLPPVPAVATNKFSSAWGTGLTTGRFAINRLIPWKATLPAILMAFIGSTLGAHLALVIDTRVMTYLLHLILPVTAFLVLNKNLFKEHDASERVSRRVTALIACLLAFFIGIYDGFYGPGTGTFLIIGLTILARLPMTQANGMTKAINLTTNVAGAVVYLINGQVLLTLGIAAAAANMLGNYVGSGLAMKNGTRITRPIILAVLVLLLIKVIFKF